MYQIGKTYPNAIIIRDALGESRGYYPDGRATVLKDLERGELAGIEGAWHVLDAVTPSHPHQARQALLTSPKLVHWGDIKPPFFSFRYMSIGPGRSFGNEIPSRRQANRLQTMNYTRGLKCGAVYLGRSKR